MLFFSGSGSRRERLGGDDGVALTPFMQCAVNVFILECNGVFLIIKGNFQNHFGQLIMQVHLSSRRLVITLPTDLLNRKWEVT